MLEALDFERWRALLLQSLEQMVEQIARFLPTLIGSLLLLVVGWAIGRTLEIATRRALHALGLDRASARLGVGAGLARAGVALEPSQIVARLLFWLVFLSFVLSGVETLGLTAVTGTIDRLIAYIPNLIGAGLIVVLGLLLARLAGGVVASAASAASVGSASRVGVATQGAVSLLVIIAAIEQLGIQTDVLLAPLTALIAAVAFSAGLAFALGARPVVTHILAGHFLRQSLPHEGVVEVSGRSGVIERVGATDTVLRSGEQSWSIPNGVLLEQIVER